MIIVLTGKGFYLSKVQVTGIGNGINNLLPFRVGDILRVYFGKQFFSLDIPHTLAADARDGERSEGAYSGVGWDFLPSVSDCKKSLRGVESVESPCVVEP
ncbi:hypothetical protein [Candidiatus Paracoxiella cheracis]|uniref:hypothetical protein n=1 Tax=Candidiatus Paracoxiella cheracis TaxID=3405120 RepID=UPI003BF4DC7C